MSCVAGGVLGGRRATDPNTGGLGPYTAQWAGAGGRSLVTMHSARPTPARADMRSAHGPDEFFSNPLHYRFVTPCDHM